MLTGRGAEIILIDDPLKPEEALSEAQRQAANEWYDQPTRAMKSASGIAALDGLTLAEKERSAIYFRNALHRRRSIRYWVLGKPGSLTRSVLAWNAQLPGDCRAELGHHHQNRPHRAL